MSTTNPGRAGSLNRDDDFQWSSTKIKMRYVWRNRITCRFSELFLIIDASMMFYSQNRGEPSG